MENKINQMKTNSSKISEIQDPKISPESKKKSRANSKENIF